MSVPSPIPCHVFTRDWIAEKKGKYENLPEYKRPELYHLWTSDECQQFRERIEQSVDLLSPEKRARVIPRLRVPEQFEQTYNELAVGDSLRLIGHSVEYEVELQGLTPDWLVHPAVNSSDFIVEVVSSKPPVKRERCDNGWEVLGAAKK